MCHTRRVSNVKERKSRGRLIFWALFIMCVALLYLVNIQYMIITTETQLKTILFNQYPLKGFLIKTPGCRIPLMDPFDYTITTFIKKEKQPICNKGIPPLIDSNLTSVFLVHSSLGNYTNQDLNAIHCCYHSFNRVQPRPKEVDNKVKFGKKCIPFHISAQINEEFIKVTCKVDNTTIYTDFFSFVPVKIKEKQIIEKRLLSVLIVGMDAVSRLNFHRQMPKSVEYLSNINAIELLGYNKVGDNTFPNLIPVLTGLSEDELREVCWENVTTRFDNCPFIWKDYKAKGFVTSFGEDSSWMGILNYQKAGFEQQPTDYMWGAFNRIAEDQIGNSQNMNSVMECVGAREVYKVFLDYMTNFVTKMDMEQLSYFAFYWGASLTHDYLNKPNLGDKDYYNFFKNLKINGHLENTVMIVMSDHGIRWGDIRQTYQGRMEERLPFVFMVLPEVFKRQYQDAYNNLFKNSRRLTTPYDLHETLKDFLDPSRLKPEVLQSKKQPNLRGYSLFKEISSSRTCETANISSHWCTCQRSIALGTNATMVAGAAKFAVDHINRQLMGYAQCSNLSLSGINEARLMTHDEQILNGNDSRDYMIIFQTTPGDAIFEVTLRAKLDNKIIHHYEVVDTISRLNLYGKQSRCISDFHLKLYCYCKN